MAGAKGEGRIASQHQHVRPWPDFSLSRVKFDFNLDIPWTGAGSPEAHGCKVPAQDLRAYSELGLYHVLTTTDPFVQQWSSRMYERVTPDEPEIILSTTEIPGGLTTYSSRSLFQDGRHGEKLNVMLRDCDMCIESRFINLTTTCLSVSPLFAVFLRPLAFASLAAFVQRVVLLSLRNSGMAIILIYDLSGLRFDSHSKKERAHEGKSITCSDL